VDKKPVLVTGFFMPADMLLENPSGGNTTYVSYLAIIPLH
jgi:hypothetical protein